MNASHAAFEICQEQMKEAILAFTEEHILQLALKVLGVEIAEPDWRPAEMLAEDYYALSGGATDDAD